MEIDLPNMALTNQIKANTVSERNVPQTKASSFDDHAHDCLFVLDVRNGKKVGRRSEHDHQYQMSCVCQNENENDARYVDAQDFSQHYNVDMFPKHNPSIVLLVMSSILKPASIDMTSDKSLL